MRRCGRGRETYPVGLRSLGHLDFVVYLLVRAYQLCHGAGEFNLFIIQFLGPGILIRRQAICLRVVISQFRIWVLGFGFGFGLCKPTIRGSFSIYVFGRLFACECEISQTLITNLFVL